MCVLHYPLVFSGFYRTLHGLSQTRGYGGWNRVNLRLVNAVFRKITHSSRLQAERKTGKTRRQITGLLLSELLTFSNVGTQTSHRPWPNCQQLYSRTARPVSAGEETASCYPCRSQRLDSKERVKVLFKAPAISTSPTAYLHSLPCLTFAWRVPPASIMPQFGLLERHLWNHRLPVISRARVLNARMLSQTSPAAEVAVASKGLPGRTANSLLQFDDVSTAFRAKSDWELFRALSMLWMCSFEYVADNSLKLMTLGQRVLGERLWEWTLRRTVYGQFCAGDSAGEIRQAVRRLLEVNVGPLLAAPMEDEIHSFHPDADGKFNANLDFIIRSMTLAKELDPDFPMIQLKVTALMPGDLCALISKVCPRPSESPGVVEGLAAAIQGRTCNVDQLIGKDAEAGMKHHLEQGVRRAAAVCQVAARDGVIVMVDAEYTYLNPALNLLALAMMLVCNAPDRPPLVFYTYQHYLKSTPLTLERDMDFTKDYGVGFGAKMVRGAYLHKERQLAATSGRPDPVHDSYAHTSSAYDAAVRKVLDKMAAATSEWPPCRMIVATHNEESVLAAVKRMRDLGLEPGNGDVFFGQLLGMSDHVSFGLGVNGYLARKSLPYGPVAETLPYLSRRAQENKAIFEGCRRERQLLVSELKKRLLGKLS